MKKLTLMFACIVTLTAEQKTAKTAFLAFATDPSTTTSAGFAIDKTSIKILSGAPDAKGAVALIAKIKILAVDVTKISTLPAGVVPPAPADQVMSYQLSGICMGNQALNLTQDVTAV